MEYILSEREDGCFLCGKDDSEGEPARPLLRSELAFVILNGYPYNPGHLLVAPNRHVAELEALEGQELAEVSRLLQRSIGALKEASRPDGFNLGMNLGRVAGAGVPQHLHWHVVPRWSGDTNFMPIVGRTRVLPELLADTYARLKPHFA
ncbi:HIT domain-containing protein [soil metagenome]|nr:HIT domain-containing protein [Actinomycetota bacterium]